MPKFKLICKLPLVTVMILVGILFGRLPSVAGRDGSLDKHIPLRINFCTEVKAVRSSFNAYEGVAYVYHDAERQVLSRVHLRHNFMADRIEEQHEGVSDGFYATGAWIGPLNMWLQVGVSRMQIAGHFENRDETFDLSYSVYWSDHLEVFYRREYIYFYNNHCYLNACLAAEESFFRAYHLNFCRDSYGKYFFPLSSPCYLYNGTDQGKHIEKLFLNGTKKNDKIPHEEENPKCQKKADIYSAQVNYCGSSEQRRHAYPRLNTLFPYQFSANSKGGLFRALVFFRGTLYWLENGPPTVAYRYLEGLTLERAKLGSNFSDQWQEGQLDGSSPDGGGSLAEKFYFASAFVHPQFGNHLDRVYFLLLPRANLTADTQPVYRKVATMLPLTFHPQELTLDNIIGRNCTKWLSHLLPAKSLHHHMFAILLVSFLAFFLLLVTLFTCDFSSKRGGFTSAVGAGGSASSDSLPDHAQSVLLDEMRKK